MFKLKFLFFTLLFFLSVFLGWYFLTLSDYQRLAQDTHLDLIEIELSNKDIYKIDQRVDPPKNSPHHQIKSHYVVGQAKFKDDVFPIELRTRGSFEFHKIFTRKSWRLKTSFHRPIFPDTIRYNLARSRLPHFEDHLGYQLAHDLGIPTPQSLPLLFVLNADWQGLYHYTEQMDELFLKKNDLPYGPIFGEYRKRSENRKITDYEVVSLGDVSSESPWTNGFENINNTLWQYLSMRSEQETGKAEKLNEFLKTIHLPEEDFIREISKKLDMPSFLKWLSLQTLAGSAHTNIHNIRLFYNPENDRFQFFNWDMMPFYDYVSHRLMPLNWVPVGQTLFLKLFLSPEFDELRNREIWRLIQSDLPLEILQKKVETLYHTLRAVYAIDPEKAFLGPSVTGNAPLQNRIFSLDDFSNHHKNLLEWLKFRYDYLEKSLKISEVTAGVLPQGKATKQIIIEHRTESGLELTEFIFTDEGKNQKFSGCHVAFDANHNGLIESHELLKEIKQYHDAKGWLHVTYDSPPVFLANRRQVPIHEVSRGLGVDMGLGYQSGLAGNPEQVTVSPVYYSLLVGLKNHREEFPKFSLILKNTVTGDWVTPQWKNIASTQNIKSWGKDARQSLLNFSSMISRSSPEPQSLTWHGEKEITETFFVNQRDTLTIEPGTKIRFGKNAGLMVFGELIARGTKEAPIVFTAGDTNMGWMGIAANNNPKPVVLEHVILEYATGGRIRSIPYTGALSVYNGELVLKNSVIRHTTSEDAVSVKYGKAHVSDSDFEDNQDGVDLEFSHGEIQNSFFKNHQQDSIDLDSAVVQVNTVQIQSSQDKGISVGGDSLLDIKNSKIQQSQVGMAIKDSSRVLLESTFITNNEIGIEMFSQNRAYKLYPPGLKMGSGDIVHNKKDMSRSGKTSVVVSGGQIGEHHSN